MSRQPWPDKFVENRHPSRANLADLRRILDTARDERPLQEFLSQTPSFLRKLVPSCNAFWCFSQPPLGRELFPDFLLCYRNSRGLNWAYVEIESPTQPPLNKNGRPSAKVTEAISQISDWRIWLRDNIAYARQHHGLLEIDAEAPSIVIIGRRDQLDARHAAKYRALTNSSVSVMTYDRLLDEQPTP